MFPVLNLSFRVRRAVQRFAGRGFGWGACHHGPEPRKAPFPDAKLPIGRHCGYCSLPIRFSSFVLLRFPGCLPAVYFNLFLRFPFVFYRFRCFRMQVCGFVSGPLRRGDWGRVGLANMAPALNAPVLRCETFGRPACGIIFISVLFRSQPYKWLFIKPPPRRGLRRRKMRRDCCGGSAFAQARLPSPAARSLGVGQTCKRSRRLRFRDYPFRSRRNPHAISLSSLSSPRRGGGWGWVRPVNTANGRERRPSSDAKPSIGRLTVLLFPRVVRPRLLRGHQHHIIHIHVGR